MKEHDAFPVAHLKWQDLEQRPVRLMIDSVVLGEVGAEKDIKPIISFKGTEKTFVCNKTNFGRIALITGQDDTDNWGGYQITLAKDVTEYGGKTVNCIRVQANSATTAAPAQAPPPVEQPDDYPTSAGPDLDDIPF